MFFIVTGFQKKPTINSQWDNPKGYLHLTYTVHLTDTVHLNDHVHLTDTVQLTESVHLTDSVHLLTLYI